MAKQICFFRIKLRLRSSLLGAVFLIVLLDA
jgi:hypothetical protein